MAQDFSTFGMAALLPGIQYTLDQIQTLIDNFRAQLAAAQGSEQIGAPRRKSPWAGISPEQRSAEMKRRQAVSRGAAPSKNKRGVRVVPVVRVDEEPATPLRKSDPRHPQYDEWRARVGAGRKAAWDKMSKAKQKAQLAKMQKAREEKFLARMKARAAA